MQVKLPFSIDAAKVDAVAGRHGERLHIRLPFRAYTDVLADRGSVLDEVAAC